MYPSGLSTSLPADVQLQYFRSMVGFERVEIMRPGYAIEYDFVEPRQIRATLETREIEGLFHAGQINGTSGYEEAAGQGLLAGINAALQCLDKEPLIIRRDQGYLGVMVDDLVTQETTEPYRMFTSRAEYRLLLREDNADLRLTGLGRRVGLVSDLRWEQFEKKIKILETASALCKETNITNKNERICKIFGLGDLKSGTTLEQIIKRPEITIQQIKEEIGELKNIPEKVLEQVEIAIKYEGYIARQIEQVERFVGYEKELIPEDIDYAAVSNLSTEVREKLIKYRPTSLGQAGRIQGVTPAAVAVLNVYLRKKLREKKTEARR